MAVFFTAGCLADKHQPTVGIAVRKDQRFGGFLKRTSFERLKGRSQLLEGCCGVCRGARCPHRFIAGNQLGVLRTSCPGGFRRGLEGRGGGFFHPARGRRRRRRRSIRLGLFRWRGEMIDRFVGQCFIDARFDVPFEKFDQTAILNHIKIVTRTRTSGTEGSIKNGTRSDGG